jgi:arylsulfatase A-like enzyme
LEPTTRYLAWNVVHAPCEAPDYYVNQNSHIASKSRRNFAGMVSALDDSLPQVIDALKAKKMW